MEPNYSPTEDDLPTEGEDLASILAEMEALQAVFEVGFRNGDAERAKALCRHALDLWSDKESVAGRLTTFALAHCAGVNVGEDWTFEPEDLFETLAVSWIRWMRDGDPRVLDHIHNYPNLQENDREAETLSLNFWAQAIELLVLGDREQAKQFFERSTEVGSQFGTNTNPYICWTYAASFFPAK